MTMTGPTVEISESFPFNGTGGGCGDASPGTSISCGIVRGTEENWPPE